MKHHHVRHFPGKQLRDRAVPLIGEVAIEPDVERRQDQLVAVDGTSIVATIPAIRRRVVGSYLYRAPTEEHGIYFPRRDGRRPAIVHPCRLRCDVLMPSACLGERPGHTASFSRAFESRISTLHQVNGIATAGSIFGASREGPQRRDAFTGSGCQSRQGWAARNVSSDKPAESASTLKGRSSKE